MLTQTWDTTADCTVALLLHYIFDLSGYSARELVECWLSRYPSNWVRWATIEALYQGRYKAVSVEQILGIWQRRGQALPRFNCEFERLVCGNTQPRLSRHSDRHLTTNPFPPSLKPAAYGSNSTQQPSMTKKAATATSQLQPMQIVEVTAEVVPANKQVAVVSSQNQQRQLSSEWQNSSRRRLPALPSHPSQQPIQQFHPEKTKASDFYIKLKAISRHH